MEDKRLVDTKSQGTFELTTSEGPVVVDWYGEPEPRGVVVFLHGSGSGRESPRNRHVARALASHGWKCVLFDLLTVEERRVDNASGCLRFDIDRLCARSEATLRALWRTPGFGGPLIVLGSSTGAAVAAAVSARYPELVDALVSRGGRLDLVSSLWSSVRVPCLLVWGERDKPCREVAMEAARWMSAPSASVEIPGASHLLPEPGALDQFISATSDWLDRTFAVDDPTTRGNRLRYRNRNAAGLELARRLERWRDRVDALVVGLPRGGVPVAAAVA
ncbi:MAG: alpha/beta fold hydrolase, partial [Armatimonadota bacterium]